MPPYNWPCDLNSVDQAAYGVDATTIADADKGVFAFDVLQPGDRVGDETRRSRLAAAGMSTSSWMEKLRR